jgi:hypothetical protein
MIRHLAGHYLLATWILLLVPGAPACAQTSVQFELSPGINQLCVFDISAVRSCVPIGWLTFTLASGAATGNFGFALLNSANDLGDLANPATARGHLNIRQSSPLDYGAKCDGVTDDTTALTNWIASITAGTKAVIPNGACIFKNPLTFPLINLVTLEGAGKQSGLLYAGTATTGTMVQVGSTDPSASYGCAAKAWTIRNLRVMSNTHMTGGVGLLLGHLCEADISNLEVGGDLDGNQNWYNAVQFYGGNSIHLRGYSFAALNIAEIVNGDATYQMTDLFQSGGGKISHSLVGLNIAGNVGGFTLDQTDILLNGTNVQIDQSQIATPNNQLFFGPGVAIDLTVNGVGQGIGLNVADSGSTNSFIFFSGTWIASALPGPGNINGECVYAQSGVTWKIVMNGGAIFGCRTDGFRNDSLNVTAHFSGTYIASNSGYGLNNTVANSKITASGVRFGVNNPANTNNVPTGQTIDSSLNQFTLSAGNNVFSASTGKTAIIGTGLTNSDCGLWLAGGTATPGKMDQSSQGCTFNLGASSYKFANGYITTLWPHSVLSADGDLEIAPLDTSHAVRLEDGAGNTLLRTTSNSGNSNSGLLVRGDTGAVTLMPESGSLNANIAFTPKNSGLVQIYSMAPNLSGIIKGNGAGSAATAAVNGTDYFAPTGSGGLALAAKTVSTLPSCNARSVGNLYYVTDANAPSWNATVSGGGSAVVMAFCNGANWVAH